jgi:benzoyl-CoA reductase/2-hydroxyglutaryl-CoA dehydratase subunit BcrC/BadD/HgdB
MPQDPNAAMGGGDPNAMGGADPMGGQDPNGGMGGDDQMQDLGAMGDEDPLGDEENDGSTISVDGLTKAQDKLNVKQNHIGRDLSKVDTRITSLIDTINNLLTKVDSNNSEIESLKAEFEKRNPTQTEKLNLRSLDSYPFNVKPNEYWAEKAKEGGYQAYSDNAEPTSKEYTITNDDVDNPSDDIAKTFFKIDDDDIQTLDKLFNF